MTVTGLVCGTCGAELPPNSKFCNECGAAVAASAKPAEYKQVTVLFADVVHSMDIAAAVGAERLREIMTELVNQCAAVVQHFGGRVDKFTGDGVMAVFGAPVALEDHALRACLAALDILNETQRLAAEVQRRDGIAFQLRIGLNSGQVIAGEIGSGALGYTAIGEQVGMAQRMESVAPPGGVMLSESTAQLVEDAAVLGEPEMVHIKGVGASVRARRLLAVGGHESRRRREPSLVGRTWELNTLAGILEEAMGGAGCVVTIVGPAGIGKSRLVREAASIAAGRGVETFTSYCESHASDIPFHVVARLLRVGMGVNDLDASTARAHVRAEVPGADPEDMLLFDDLLGIGDPAVSLPDITPDARRRRLTALVNAVSLAREEAAVYVVEDVHWIDAVSESMLADFLAVIPQTHSMVLITYRPEYHGPLTRVSGAQTVALRPLSEAHTATLTAQLLGTDPSIVELAAQVAARVAGNPFFVEEIVRDLAERGVLHGEPGAYVLRGEVADVEVPGHPAGHHRRAHRSAWPHREAHPERCGRDRVTIRHRCADRPGRQRGCGPVDRGGARRSGALHPARRVRVSAPVDPHGGLRVATQVRSRAAAPAAGGRDRSARIERRERVPDRRASGGRRRSARRLRLAHARRNLVDHS